MKEATNVQEGEHGDGNGHKLVTVTVNEQPKEVEKGKYSVVAFKALVGVPSDYVLDEFIDGVLTELADTATLHIKGGEKFVGHVKQGGSS
jgi:hypothetical protein